jgi:hypothetical protein
MEALNRKSLMQSLSKNLSFYHILFSSAGYGGWTGSMNLGMMRRAFYHCAIETGFFFYNKKLTNNKVCKP